MFYVKRNETGLHCRFCETYRDNTFQPNLYETFPVKGIVCEDCMEHLQDYIKFADE